MPQPRNTHSATMSCRLPSPIVSATPNAYRRTRPTRCNHKPIRLAVIKCVSFSSFSKPSHPLSPRSGSHEGTLSEAPPLWKTSICVEESAVTHTQFLTSPRSLHSSTHKDGVMGNEVRRTAHARGHTQKQRHPRRTAR
ncbi:hypothetical protein TcCL_Unassigned03332 [Trypanosoma cruzi]|nr:hypothetical protein TcCL_Unassigned03332 [Trypanosoma cruzi]